ncbi:MAG: METTL5 family protein [Halanaeroarchaeum sp.]
MKRELARRLESVADFEDPSAPLEQYQTPAELAASVVHLASLHDDLAGRIVVDLGAGTGMLALGAAHATPARVLGIEIDGGAVRRARRNERSIDAPMPVDWIRGDATNPPVAIENATVVMNPPFGAQDGRRHADRRFLAAAASIASVSYSIHNEGSRPFVDSFAADNGGEVTHAYAAEFEVPHRFSFHQDQSRTLQTEVFRIVWKAASPD